MAFRLNNLRNFACSRPNTLPNAVLQHQHQPYMSRPPLIHISLSSTCTSICLSIYHTWTHTGSHTRRLRLPVIHAQRAKHLPGMGGSAHADLAGIRVPARETECALGRRYTAQEIGQRDLPHIAVSWRAALMIDIIIHTHIVNISTQSQDMK